MSKKSRSQAQPNPGRFRQGRSGNPGGRPKSAPAPRSSPLDILLDETLNIVERGVERQLSLEEALQLRTFQDALRGKAKAVRQVVEWILKYEEWHKEHEPKYYTPIIRHISPDPDNANAALVLLGIATVTVLRPEYGLDDRGLLLEPWATQMALSRRRGGRPLTDDEQREIKRCTRNRESLRWPRSMGQ